MLKRLMAMASCVALSLAAPVYAADNTMFNGKTITYIVATAPAGVTTPMAGCSRATCRNICPVRASW